MVAISLCIAISVLFGTWAHAQDGAFLAVVPVVVMDFKGNWDRAATYPAKGNLDLP